MAGVFLKFCQPRVGAINKWYERKKEMEMRIVLAIVFAASLVVAAGCGSCGTPVCNPCAAPAPAPVVCNPCAGL